MTPHTLMRVEEISRLFNHLKREFQKLFAEGELNKHVFTLNEAVTRLRVML